MARNREFDPQEAVAKAMLVFWQKGYVDTSIDDLVKATGVSRYGLYDEYGSKRGLFLATLDYYQDTAVKEFFGIVEQKHAGLNEIKLYFDRILEIYTQPAGQFGCLMCNSATEVAPHDKGVESKVKLALDRMSGGFGKALNNALKQKEVRQDLNIKQTADFLTSVLLGISVLARSGASKQMIKNTVSVSLATL